jgi:hypothetical protein
MKIVLRILLGLFTLAIAVFAVAYLDGVTLPVNHSTTVTGTVNAAPAMVFAKLADVANGPSFRPEVKSVKVLDATPGHERWIEDLGRRQTMSFQVVKNTPPTRRDVKLVDPKAAYGGAWVYELTPGPTPGTTTLTITEIGFIHPPVYRFVMQHVIGMQYNLNIYLKDMQKAFPH